MRRRIGVRVIIANMRKPVSQTTAKHRNRRWLTAARSTFRQIVVRQTDKTSRDAKNRLVPQWHRIPPLDSDLREHFRSPFFALSGSSVRRSEAVDTSPPQPNNAPMSKPETVRRIKSYSAENGYVYQYQFQDVHPAQRDAAKGNEFIYYVSADRKTMFPIRIFVRREALDQWTKQTGRALTGTEEYAVAKMRLFQALDEVTDFATTRPELIVDASDLPALLERLDL
jgi:hypothetical protein